MKTGKQILDEFNSQPFGVIEGYKTLEEMIDDEINSLVNEVSRLNLLISAARKHGEDSELPFYEMMKLLNGEKK